MNIHRERMRRHRDYNRRSIVNPYFKHGHGGGIGSRIKMALVLVILGGLVYGIIYSPLLRIQGVDVSGTESADVEHVRAAAAQAISGYSYAIIPNDHLFFIHRKSVSETLVGLFSLRAATVTTRFRHLQVRIEERKGSYRLVESGMGYILDQDGLVLRAANGTEGENLIAVTRAAPTEVIAGTRVLDAATFTFIDALHRDFATQAGVREQIYEVDTQKATITAVTVEGWRAIFDPSVSVEAQLKSLNSAIVAKFGPTERAKLDYIDVRFGDRLFYKMR